ncbi:hypothetical protein B4065_0276 [Caldibacillus thermoamylovorans]|uniref:Uncharacterized protein n=1 Tax=Caldibacillus thermoamylovorans TaxID=35841 RepID=A0ABD4A1G4_9BACI|nr:hypothetical protein B4065_0276 [Caldibacillus thermoamylovorans]KIO69210.1 hypothetical protein B4166_1930 [Caldibacillus thermoamylovorans]KIO70068.1 hypothetical protein B4167_0758 [Caldibacillus thermoamylovorans]
MLQDIPLFYYKMTRFEKENAYKKIFFKKSIQFSYGFQFFNPIITDKN